MKKNKGFPYGTVVRKSVELLMDWWTEWALARHISATASYSSAAQYNLVLRRSLVQYR